VIQQNASASEEMAATTEELSGQADQLIHALGFFKTREDATVRLARPATSKTPRSAESNPVTTHRAEGHRAPADRGKTAGFALKMKEKGGSTDKEFERY
jgi:methyl-accepting chemotaxis protein